MEHLKISSKTARTRKENSSGNSCPICWGYQEYDRKIRVIYEDRQIDVNNHRFKYMRIQKLLKEHIEGMRLKAGEIYECPTCSGEPA